MKCSLVVNHTCLCVMIFLVMYIKTGIFHYLSHEKIVNTTNSMLLLLYYIQHAWALFVNGMEIA